MTYQIIITEETSANIIIDNNTTNVSITTTEYPITIEYNATQLTGAYGNANVAANLAAFANNPISTSGNITAGFFVGNGSLLTGIATSSYGNANVAANLAAFGSNPISTSGNITAGYFAGNGSLLTNITAGNITGTVANATYALTANAATYSTNAIQANVANVANSVAGANVSGTVANATYALNSNAATFAGTVTTAAQPNITSVGILTAINTSGNASATGNITGSYFLGNGSQLTGLPVQPGTYGNANVAANLAAFATNPISTTGNITSGNLNVGIDAVITGNLTVNGTTTTVNSNTVTINDKFINVANNASTAALANGGGLGVGPVGTEYATLTYNSAGNIWTTNIGVSVTGNVTGNYILGNGSQLTDLPVQPGTYGNANVAANLAAFATNPISTSGNITAGFFVGNGSQLTGIASTYGNANVAANLAAFANNPISTSGNITSGNGTVTNTLYASNITGAAGQTVTITADGTNDIHLDADSIRIGDNNTAATLVTHGTGNLILRTHEGDASQGNITLVNGANGNIQLNPNGTGQVVAGTISASGNVTANYFIGNGSALTSITGANVSGTVANATYATSAGSATTATTANTVTDAAQPNITSVGTLTSASVSGNVDAGNLRTAGQVTATGNVTGGNLLTGGLITATGNVTGGNVATAGLITATANVTGGNLITAGTVSATAATVNVALSNVVITSRATNSGQQIYPATASDISGSATTINPGRMLFGNGYQGNVTNAVDNNNRQTKTRFGFWDTANVPAAYAGSSQNMVSSAQHQLLGNTNSAARLFSTVNFNIVASEGAANTFVSTGTVPAAVAGFNCFAIAGNWKNSTILPNVGNVVVNTGAGGVFGTVVYTNSTMGNSYGIVSTQQSTDGTINNQIYYTAWDSLSGTPSTPGNVFVYHNPGTTNSYGVTHSNIYRASGNYYFLRNDDAVAQTQLGTLRSYNEYQYSTATSGTVNIDKTNAQVQFLNPTANVTIGDFQNFVTTLNDGTNNDNETDTVTLIIQQGATPYTVTMPTGNAAIKYAGGVSTIGTTANAVTMVTVTAIRSAANASLYLASVSSEFS